MEREELIYACALSRIFNLNCQLANKLLDYFGSPSLIFSAKQEELEFAVGRKYKGLKKISENNYIEESIREIEWAKKYGINIIFIGDNNYPKRLRICEDAPIIIYYKGTADLNAKRIISVVGTRRASEYGKAYCRKIIKTLSSINPRPIIISGLAYGIDITAHCAAMDYGLETIGIMATGLDKIFPSAHRNIAAKMLNNGGLLSDFPSNTSSLPLHFIKRNRIIAGISDATILLESDKNGGGVITSKMADSYSRDVFALPGRVNDKYSKGCNYLIQQLIARSISSPEYILKCMNWEIEDKKSIIFDKDSDVKRKILLALSDNSMDIESLVKVVSFSPQEIASGITELELEGRIKLICNKFSIL